MVDGNTAVHANVNHLIASSTVTLRVIAEAVVASSILIKHVSHEKLSVLEFYCLDDPRVHRL